MPLADIKKTLMPVLIDYKQNRQDKEGSASTAIASVPRSERCCQRPYARVRITPCHTPKRCNAARSGRPRRHHAADHPSPGGSGHARSGPRCIALAWRRRFGCNRWRHGAQVVMADACAAASRTYCATPQQPRRRNKCRSPAATHGSVDACAGTLPGRRVRSVRIRSIPPINLRT